MTTAPASSPGLRACLFDLDGTLINTEPQYSRLWKAIGERYLPLQPTFHTDIKGTTLAQILNRYFPDEALQKRISDELDAFEGSDMVFEFFPGAVAFVQELRAHGVLTAIVTSSNQRKMDVVRRKLPACSALFDAVLTSEDFRASKPSPDCFLAAARRLQVPTSACAVFEDAPNGLEAGMRSGMLTIGMVGSLSLEEIQGLCHAARQGWGETSYEWVAQQLQKHNELTQ